MPGLIDILHRRVLVRRVVILVAHAALYALAFWGAFLLRFDFKVPHNQQANFWGGLGQVVVFRLLAGVPFHIYGGVLRYASIKDLVDIVKAMSAASAAFVVALVLVGLSGFPRSIIAIDWLASIMLVGGLRFGLRLAREALTAGSTAGSTAAGRKRVLILGAGDAGEALVRDLNHMYRERYEVVGFLDDNPAKRGLRIHDVPVLGPLPYLGDFVPRYQVDEVIIAIPTATRETMRKIVDIAKVAGVRFKTIPGVDQLIDGSVTVNQIRDVAIEDLLGRDPVRLEQGLVRRFLNDKVVMVTGAGGSIGAELCRQIIRYRPRRMVLLEQAEPFLFGVHQELRKAHPELDLVPVMADVTDAARLERVFSLHGPEVIFHAAAHKHVPMMEWNPGEAIKNNIFGTKTVADIANLFGAQAFVMISTDKAVNPTSVMGATKRVSEMYVQSLSVDSQTKFTAVRFGNVLGSVGSVVPTFKQQIAEGGPVTVTHPDMRRYFMTIPESCQLVMQSAAMGEGGEIFVLDMGEPVKIVDLARDLITLSGFEPDRDIEVVFTGLRPGEKLFEEIGFDAEKMDKTRHPKVYVGKLTRHAHQEMLRKVEFLLGVANDTDEDVIKAALKAVVPEFDTDVPAAALPTVQPADYAQQRTRRPVTVPRPVAPEPRPLATQVAAEPPEPIVAQANPVAPPTPEPANSRLEAGRQPAACDDGSETRNEARSTKHEERISPPDVPVLDAEPGNPLFDPVWDFLTAVCQERGFTGVAWATMGVRPPDRREIQFNGSEAEASSSSLRRSMPISSLAFVDVRFYYEGDGGKRTPDHIKKAVREVASRLTLEFLHIGREVQPTLPPG